MLLKEILMYQNEMIGMNGEQYVEGTLVVEVVEAWVPDIRIYGLMSGTFVNGQHARMTILVWENWYYITLILIFYVYVKLFWGVKKTLKLKGINVFLEI